jgi:hypothetical protein
LVKDAAKVTVFHSESLLPAHRPDATPNLLDLGDQNIANHDLWNAPGELQNVVSDPVGGLLIGDQGLIGDVSPENSSRLR